MAEAKCLQLLRDSNRPYNVQGVADMLATQGVKKAMAEKALAVLAEQGKVVCKEFGKTKLYFPQQEGLAQLSPEGQAEVQAAIKELQQKRQAEEEAVAALKRELSEAQLQLTVEEMRAQIAELSQQAQQLEGKLEALRSGAVLVSAEQVAKAEKEYGKALGCWAQYRRAFSSVWDGISENIEGKEADLFEEMGVDTDKALGLDLSEFRALLQAAKRPKK